MYADWFEIGHHVTCIARNVSSVDYDTFFRQQDWKGPHFDKKSTKSWCGRGLNVAKMYLSG